MNKKILGIDFGERRMGFALSDITHTFAGRLCSIDCLRKHPLDAIHEILKEHNIGSIVVGYPLRTDGKPGEKEKVVDAFITQLEEKFRLPVYREDERYSSVRAQEILKQNRSKKALRKMNKSEIDEVAASLILQDYLDRQRGLLLL